MHEKLLSILEQDKDAVIVLDSYGGIPWGIGRSMAQKGAALEGGDGNWSAQAHSHECIHCATGKQLAYI